MTERESHTYPPLKAPTGLLTGSAAVEVSINLALVRSARREGWTRELELSTELESVFNGEPRLREAIMVKTAIMSFH